MEINEFKLPDGMHGRFAVVKLWPELKAAEDENIARFKNTAKRLGLKCVEITSEGEIIGSGGIMVSKNNCDFVIHLHFETPKIYDVFSFVALWNPIQFYHDWGYERFSRHLLTHDDFLSCDSPAADDHVIRLIHNDPFHLPPKFKLHHSLSEPIHKPKNNPLKLFYAGINWEKLGKGKSRHQELLEKLDPTGRLCIYGPKLFQGVNVWEGYSSYQHEIPFDGVSMIHEIAGCGAALVLSSDAHKKSGLMSNRLFEGLAAGALIICDENPFAQKHFGDSLLYIDCSESVEKQFDSIMQHLNWAAENQEQARSIAEKAQSIFLDKFALDLELSNIYKKLNERKTELSVNSKKGKLEGPKIRAFILQNEFNLKKFLSIIRSLNNQIYRNFKASFVINTKDFNQVEELIQAELHTCEFDYDFIKMNPHEVSNFLKTGDLIRYSLSQLEEEDAFLFIAPNESIMSNHFETLATLYSRDPDRNAYATSALLFHEADGKRYYDYYDGLTFDNFITNKPNGFARILINRKSVRKDVGNLLSALNFLAISAFLDESLHIKTASISTCIIKIQEQFPANKIMLDEEICALHDYYDLSGFNIIPSLISNLDALNDQQLTISSMYQAIIGRDPSKEELSFYEPVLEKYGRKRLLQDISLSREAARINGIRSPLRWAMRNLWKT